MRVLIGGGRAGALGMVGAIAALAASGIGATVITEQPNPPRMCRPAPRRVMRGFVPASINRNTGKPHEHAREIARRARQQERLAAK